MDVSAHFLSLSAELNALKNRIRNFIADHHWLTDGEWKETVLRTILKRHVPASIEVGRGFIITSHICSTQIDVLLYDNTKPVLYKEGDLAFVTPDAVRGIIEVKSRVTMSLLSGAAEKLAKNAELTFLSLNMRKRQKIFVGLFAYDTDITVGHSTNLLNKLQEIAGGKPERVVNHICLGDDLFVRFWKRKPRSIPPENNYNHWHFYNLPQLSQGYFINNVVDSLASSSVRANRAIWFPLNTKEFRKLASVPLSRT